MTVQIGIGNIDIFLCHRSVNSDFCHRIRLIGDKYLTLCGQIRLGGGQAYSDLHHHFIFGLKFSLYLIDNSIPRGLRHCVTNTADLRLADDRFDLCLVF